MAIESSVPLRHRSQAIHVASLPLNVGFIAAGAISFRVFSLSRHISNLTELPLPKRGGGQKHSVITTCCHASGHLGRCGTMGELRASFRLLTPALFEYTPEQLRYARGSRKRGVTVSFDNIVLVYPASRMALMV